MRVCAKVLQCVSKYFGNNFYQIKSETIPSKIVSCRSSSIYKIQIFIPFALQNYIIRTFVYRATPFARYCIHVEHIIITIDEWGDH